MNTERLKWTEAKIFASAAGLTPGTREYDRFLVCYQIESNLKKAIEAMTAELKQFPSCKYFYGHIDIYNEGAVKCQVRANTIDYKIFPVYEFGDSAGDSLMHYADIKIEDSVDRTIYGTELIKVEETVSEILEEIKNDWGQCDEYVRVNITERTDKIRNN